MFGKIKRKKCEVFGKTVYMEICGINKVSYRVVAGRILADGEEIVTYGIEAQDLRTGEQASIPDFSHDIEDAVDFAEMLISSKQRPSQLYSSALDYLRISI